MTIARWATLMLLASLGVITGARQQGQSQPSQEPAQQASTAKERKQNQDQLQKYDEEEDPVVIAARRAREEKKQSKAAKVYNNDNIPKAAPISIVGEAKPEATDTSVVKPEGTAAQTMNENPGTTEQRKAALEKELADAKQHLQSVSTDLDIASRKYALDQQTYYSNPNHTADSAGAAKLEIEQKLIDSQKQEVADTQKKVDDLTEKLNELEAESAKRSTNPE